MPGYTNPLLIPYPVPADSLESAVQAIPEATAKKLNDLIAAISGVAPGPVTALGVNGANGWAGEIWYAARAGLVTMTFWTTKANFVADDVISLPAPLGFRPPRTWFGSASLNGNARDVYLDAAGILRTGAAGNGGVRGNLTYPI